MSKPHDFLPINNDSLHFTDEVSKGKREKRFILSHIVQEFASRYGMFPSPSFSRYTLNLVLTPGVSGAYRESGLLG